MIVGQPKKPTREKDQCELKKKHKFLPLFSNKGIKKALSSLSLLLCEIQIRAFENLSSKILWLAATIKQTFPPISRNRSSWVNLVIWGTLFVFEGQLSFVGDMGSKREEERNEKIIRGLMKLPPNRRCINCNSLVNKYNSLFLFPLKGLIGSVSLIRKAQFLWFPWVSFCSFWVSNWWVFRY